MIWFKKKKDIPLPPTPEEVANSYENKTISIPNEEMFPEEVTEPIHDPAPIPKIPTSIKKREPIHKVINKPPILTKPHIQQAIQKKPIVQIQKPIMQKPIQPKPIVQKPEPKPFFILKKGYQVVLDSIKEVDTRIDNVQPTIDFLIKNKNKQDIKFEEIRITLEDIERKLLYVDKTMFER